jgi:hypothetical protein
MTLMFDENIPFHYNTPNRNKILYWNGSDTRESWITYSNNADNLNFYEKNNWLDEFAIEYRFNSYGFRCEEFDDRASYMALGCSFTQGIGLAVEDVWVSHLNNLIGTNVWNLGVCSLSLDGCFRLLEYYLNKLNIIGVFLLHPPKHRFEIFEDTIVQSFIPTDSTNNLYSKLWLSNENNSKINVRKNLLAMTKLCDDKAINLYIRDSDDIYQGPDCKKARDLLHPGKRNHLILAEKFYNDWKNGHS